MNLMYCGDKNIADGLIISLISIMKNTSAPLKVYVLTVSYERDGKVCEPISKEFISYLDGVLKEHNEDSAIKLFDVSEDFVKNLPEKNLETRFTPGCMVRLFADLVPELPDRILYLDNDIVCRGDFSELYYMDLDGKELVGVLDYYGAWLFKRKLLSRDYLNSGVLLLNLKEIKRTGLFKKCRERCRDKKMFMPDQSAINKLSQSKHYVSRKFNEQRKLKDDTVFQHFTTSFRFFPYFHSVSVKPWNVTQLHNTLNIYEYDSLLVEYRKIKAKYLAQEDKV